MIREGIMDGRVVWALAQGQDRVDNAWLHSLASVGCRVVCLPDASAVRDEIRRQGATEPEALVLLADIASNCRAAQSARLAWPQLSLVAWHGQQVGPEQAALLSVGVDYVLRPADPPALLVSVLLALAYRRVRFGATVRPGLFAQWDHAGGDLRIGPWRLVDLGWALEYEGASLRLSVSERALLLCLFEAPGHVASHAELIAAVLRVWQSRRRAPIRDPRCRSTISRLRRRACGAGMPTPPIESLRDFGYAWAL